jgi:glutathione S-transferase
MRLMYSANSPYVRKVMVVAHELGLQDRIEKIPAAAHPVQRDAALSATNPLGKVPALVLDDGSVLFDSPVIVEYLASLSPSGAALFPASGPARWRVLTEQALADGLLDAAVLIRYELMARPRELRWDGWIEGQNAKLKAALHRMETAANDDAVTIGAVTIACALGYLDLRFPDMDWRTTHPKRARWYETFSARPAMQATQSPELKK